VQAAGGVLGGFAFDRFSKYKSVCGPSLACQTQPQLTAANGLASDVNTFETATTISLAAGGALLVTGVVLVLTHPTKRSVAAFRTLEHLGGAAGPREGTVVWRGSF